jgi:hypothetical protein
VNEAERERVHVRIALAWLLASPWLVSRLVAAQVSPAWDQTLFLVALLAALPATFLLELLITVLLGKGAGLRFWVKQPSVRSEHEARAGLPECEAELRARLERLGFACEATGPGALRFSKPKRRQVHAFLDHAFSGRAELASSSFGTRIAVELTFADVLLIETGERSRLAALGDYLCLRGEQESSRSVPLLAYCGLTLGYATATVSLLVRFWPERTSPWLFPLSAGTVGFLAFALRAIVRDRARLCGSRLAALGLSLAAFPWIAWLLQLARASATGP